MTTSQWNAWCNGSLFLMFVLGFHVFDSSGLRICGDIDVGVPTTMECGIDRLL